ncbi:hypothetical protein B2J93_1275 [Marssonina coronariae]|uniref:Uncharacterized protein n=1 Tax=Diplocarpon coronariae TaxID=2795749 RepID=A0A218Z466_9HELO|nr:hypothetical protein B2J93_1275 [Marssonina coronariae]
MARERRGKFPSRLIVLILFRNDSSMRISISPYGSRYMGSDTYPASWASRDQVLDERRCREPPAFVHRDHSLAAVSAAVTRIRHRDLLEIQLQRGLGSLVGSAMASAASTPSNDNIIKVPFEDEDPKRVDERGQKFNIHRRDKILSDKKRQPWLTRAFLAWEDPDDQKEHEYGQSWTVHRKSTTTVDFAIKATGQSAKPRKWGCKERVIATRSSCEELEGAHKIQQKPGCAKRVTDKVGLDHSSSDPSITSKPTFVAASALISWDCLVQAGSGTDAEEFEEENEKSGGEDYGDTMGKTVDEAEWQDDSDESERGHGGNGRDGRLSQVPEGMETDPDTDLSPEKSYEEEPGKSSPEVPKYRMKR